MSRLWTLTEAEATAEEIKDKAGEADEGWHFPRPAIKSIQLKANAYFQYFVFPGVTRFKDATFTGNATFEHATFSGDAWFDSATFKRGAEFESATFKGNASFESVTFTGNAQFPHTSFIGKAAFSSAKFHGAADFENAVLNTSEINYALFKTKSYYSDLAIRAERYLLGGTIHDTSFNDCCFEECVSFENTNFFGGADFSRSSFKKSTKFDGAKFLYDADFHEISAAGPFSLSEATFWGGVPNFLYAEFAKLVLLDNVWVSDKVTYSNYNTASAKYRVLKRLAIQSDDHRSEQFFFRGELRGRRNGEDAPVFWSVLYQVFSDFGHSTLRPILWLAALGLLSSWFYLGEAAPADVSAAAHIQVRLLSQLPFLGLRPASLPPLACIDGSAGDPVAAASLLAAKKSSVFASFDSAEKSTQIYACLYGFDERTKTAIVPDAVVIWGIGQTVVSAALLFLFLLALRNQFKIK